MSTEFNGEYCSHKDKMKMGRTEAARAAKRMGGMRTYKCEHCGGWHLTHANRSKLGFQRKKINYNKPRG